MKYPFQWPLWNWRWAIRDIAALVVLLPIAYAWLAVTSGLKVCYVSRGPLYIHHVE